MPPFLRENPLLVAGVALPVAVVVLFTATSALPVWFAGEPVHDAVIAHGQRLVSRGNNIGVVLNVVDGRLRARVVSGRDSEAQRVPDEPPDSSVADYVPRLFVVDAASRETTEIEIRMPGDISTVAVGDEIPIPELADAVLDPSRRAPDGWRFEPPERGGGRGFFGAGARHHVRFVKDSAVLRAHTPIEGWSQGEPRFLGWIVERAATR